VRQLPENTSLEAAILETLDADAFRVYADWLEERGHPRGKLIALQLEHARTHPQTQRAAELEEQWNQHLGEHADALGPPPPGVTIEWRHGFWRSVVVRTDDVDLARVLAQPSARFVEKLELRGEGNHFRSAILRRTHEPLVARATTLDNCGRFLRTSRDGFAWLPALPAIQRLRLGAADLELDECLDDVGETAARRIASIHGLTALRMSSHHLVPSSISQAAFLALAPLSGTLVTLEARDCFRFDDDVCAMLAPFTKLETLRIPRAGLSSRGIRSLATLRQLRHLDISHCELDDDAGDVLGGYPALESVAIHGTNITARGVKGIGCSRTIKKLVLDGDQWPEEAEAIMGLELQAPRR
jgi:uncharacterized protein (TIGR02996 family)